jgi:hypothetical protein
MMAAGSPLEQALELSHAMLAAAREADWERLIQLEAERQPLVTRQHPLDNETHRLLGEILACDRELVTLIAQARDAAAEQWQLETGRAHAIAAYGR